MSGSGILPNQEQPDGSIDSLEEFAAATGTDWLLQLITEITNAATGFTNLQTALEQIADTIGLTDFAQLLLAAFEGIQGSFFDFLPWFINLKDLFGTDFNIDPNDFDPISIAIGIITYWLSLLDPGNLTDIPILGDIIRAILGEDGSIDDITQFLQNPFGAIQKLIDDAFDVFNFGTPGSTSNNPIEEFFNSLLGILGIGANAQTVNAAQDAILYGVSGGIVETFDGTAGADPPNFTITITGSGGGSFKLNGSGAAHLTTSGTATRTWSLRHNTPLTTDQGSTQIVLNSNIQDGFVTDPGVFLIGRGNSAGTDYVIASAWCNGCEIGYTVGGVYTRLGSTESLSGGTAGTWELKYGTATDERQLILLRNGVTVCDRTDSGDASAMDASHWYPGFGIVAGVHYFFAQLATPDIGAFAAFDRA